MKYKQLRNYLIIKGQYCIIKALREMCIQAESLIKLSSKSQITDKEKQLIVLYKMKQKIYYLLGGPWLENF